MHVRASGSRRRATAGWAAATASVVLAVVAVSTLPDRDAANVQRAAGSPGVGGDTWVASRTDGSAQAPGDGRTSPAQPSDSIAQDIVPAAARIEARTEERPLEDLIAQAHGSGPGAERCAAIDALAYAAQGDPARSGYAAAVLAQALADPDEDVRAQALSTLKDTADELPFGAVEQVLRYDPSPDRRIQALELLVERAEARADGPVRVALADPEPAVRERAAALIEDWHIDLDGG